MSALKMTAACVRCHEEKLIGAFPVGCARKRHRHTPKKVVKRGVVCWTCIEVEAHEMDVRMSARSTWIINGKRHRRCADCKGVFLLNKSNFHVSAKAGTLDENGHKITRTRYAYYCRPCHNKHSNAFAEARKSDPDARAKRAAATKRWRERNPEKARAASKRWKERTMADPERREAFLETTRISYRLRQEKKGVKLDEIRKPKGVRKPGRPEERSIPAAPLVAFIRTRIEQREAIENFLGDGKAITGAAKAVLSEFGITDRHLYRWAHEQPRVTIEMAESILHEAEVAWSDVYSRDDYPELYAPGGLLDLHVEAVDAC